MDILIIDESFFTEKLTRLGVMSMSADGIVITLKYPFGPRGLYSFIDMNA